MNRGRPFDPERPDEAMHLLDGGVPVEEALARVGWTINAAHRWAQRNHHHTLLRHIGPAYAAQKRTRERTPA